MKKVLNHPVIGLIMFCLFGVASFGLAMILFDTIENRYIFGWCTFGAALIYWFRQWYVFYQSEKAAKAAQVEASKEAQPLRLVS